MKIQFAKKMLFMVCALSLVSPTAFATTSASDVLRTAFEIKGSFKSKSEKSVQLRQTLESALKSGVTGQDIIQALRDENLIDDQIVANLKVESAELQKRLIAKKPGLSNEALAQMIDNETVVSISKLSLNGSAYCSSGQVAGLLLGGGAVAGIGYMIQHGESDEIEGSSGDFKVNAGIVLMAVGILYPVFQLGQGCPDFN